MNRRIILICFFAASLRQSVFAQGSLAPTEAPAPTMKTLTQIEPRTPISSLPFTITNSGSYYLTASLTGVANTNGITIFTNQVTIDLNGFALMGVTNSLDGINLGGATSVNYTNLTLINGTIQGWGGNGISAAYGYIQKFEGLSVNKNAGIGLYPGVFAVLHHCIVTANGNSGIYAGSAMLENCVSDINGGDGFHVGGCRLVNCVAQANLGSGIWAYAGSFVTGCLCGNNSYSGIGLGSDSVALNNNVLGNNNSASPASAAIYQFYGPGRIEGNNISYTAGYGILIAAGQTNILIIKNNTEGNSANAFSIPSGNDVGPWGTAATSTSPWANIRN